jgi:hypothetical protein
MIGQMTEDERSWQKDVDAARQSLIDEAEGELGHETVEQILDSARQVEASMLKGAMHKKATGGDPNDFSMLLREFSNNMYARYSSENLKPDPVESALREASEKMAP